MNYPSSLGMNTMRPPEMMMPGSSYYSTGGYPPFGSNVSTSSIALFHLPNDATNSLYVDGVPNDTNEREVSRRFSATQTSSGLSLASNASG